MQLLYALTHSTLQAINTDYSNHILNYDKKDTQIISTHFQKYLCPNQFALLIYFFLNDTWKKELLFRSWPAMYV